MKTEARIIEDSITEGGRRVTTVLARYATIIHQDMQTQRTVYMTYANMIGEEPPAEWCEVRHSYSTNSNRAKTTKQVLLEVWRHPFCPTKFPKRAKTMHGTEYHTGFGHHLRAFIWLKARYIMIAIAWLLSWLGVHKQIANRLVSPWQWTVIVMTGNDVWWEHLFRLRDHYMAQDEMQEIARAIYLKMLDSTPRRLKVGEWHAPFVTDLERTSMRPKGYLLLSIARCARTSYAPDFESMIAIAHARPRTEDNRLGNQLLTMDPEHAGPMEHQNQAHADRDHRSGNMFGYDQLRHHPMVADMRERAKALQASQPVAS